MKNKALVEMARCRLLEADLPNNLWGEAVVTANYLQNRISTRGIIGTPPNLNVGLEQNPIRSKFLDLDVK